VKREQPSAQHEPTSPPQDMGGQAQREDYMRSLG
jgi:hypothetical protein